MKKIFYEISVVPYKIWYGIRNLIIWSPVIWKDRQWDQSFLYAIMKKKIFLMAKNFEKFDHHEGKDKYVKRLCICYNLLDRLEKDDYFRKEHESFDYEDYMINQDLELLFEIMKKHIRTWWY